MSKEIKINVQVEENEQPIIVETPQYYAPVQSVNGKIGFVTITQQDLGISGGLASSGDLNNYYLKSNPSGFITGVDLSNYATVTNLNATGSELQSQINNRVTNLGDASGIQVMTTGAYNAITPLSGVVYILI